MGGNATNAVKKDTSSGTVQREVETVLTLNFIENIVSKIPKYDFSDVNSVPCPILPAKIFVNDHDSINVSCLCDSGASFSAISLDVFNSCQLQLQLEKAVRRRGDPSQADSSKLKCDGETVTNLSLRAISGKVLKLLNVRLTIIRLSLIHI